MVFGITPKGFQDNLNCLRDYCNINRLKVNVNKSKVMVINGQKSENTIFLFDNEELETVSDFIYLGVKVTNDGKYNVNENFLLGKAKKAEFVMDRYIAKYKFDPIHIMNMFEILIVSILNYCSEVWGNNACHLLEKYHLGFLKQLFHLKKTTSSCMVYRETGRLPLIYNRLYRMISYWVKRQKTENVLVSQFMIKCPLAKWNKDIHIILNNVNMSDAYVFGVGECNNFLRTFKNRLMQFGHNCLENMITDSRKCEMYSKFALFEEVSIIPSYISMRLSIACTRNIARFRCRNHKLLVERGTWMRPILHRNDRTCPVCHEIEDEYHYVLVCPLFSSLREHYIDKKYWHVPTMSKFVTFMNGSQSDMYGLHHFLRKSEELYMKLF